jgi:hypothetical protein
MVTPYVPEAGDIVMLDFDPQVGREQGALPNLHLVGWDRIRRAYIVVP